ncbi:MAG: tetratricopeptide repeat protein [Planctomycetota bacterium]|jgi:tetratricopeptide (TPR) repeat protein
MKRNRSRLHVILICAVLVLAVFTAYEPVRRNEFVNYDDDVYVTGNPWVKSGLTAESVKWAFTTTRAGNWHPLTWLSHMLDCELFGVAAVWHHLVNLLFHTAGSLLLFWVLNRSTGSVWASGFVAAVFAVHPVHVESVAWVAERKDVLSGFFWMLTIAAYVRCAERPGEWRYLLVVLAFCLGLMAKPMVVTLPFVLLLLDYWPLGRFQQARSGGEEMVQAGCRMSRVCSLLVEKIPLFVLAAISSVITFVIQQSSGAMHVGEGFPLRVRTSNALVSYIGYISKMLYPSRLAVLYPHPGQGLALWRVIVAILMLVCVSGCVVYLARRRRYLAVGWLWYLGVLVPVIGLVQVGVQGMADRYAYLPSIGIFIMIAWGAADICARWRYGKIALGVAAGIVLAVLVMCTRKQVGYWESNATVFGRALAVTENNFIMHSSYGGMLFEEGRFDEALVHFNEAVRINPDYSDGRRNAGIVLLKQGKIDEAIAVFSDVLSGKGDWPTAYNYLGLAYAQKGELDLAINSYNAALQLKPDYVDALKNLGIVLKEQGKTDEAVEKWTKALELEPDNPEVHYNMGVVSLERGDYDQAVGYFGVTLLSKPDWPDARYGLGAAYYFQGRFELAERESAQAVSLRPDYYDARYNLALAMARQGKYDEAVRHFKEVLRGKPDWPEPYYELAAVYYRQGKKELAVEQCFESLRLKPDYLAVRITLGQILVELGKLEPAVEQYREALEIAPDDAEVHNDLGEALAEQGEFDEAIMHFNEALRIKPDFIGARANLEKAVLSQRDKGSK